MSDHEQRWRDAMSSDLAPYDDDDGINNVRCGDIRALLADLDAARAECEQARVQLAACGVIAGCNTPTSMDSTMPNRDSYGWSESLANVERGVRREMALAAKLARCEAALLHQRDALYLVRDRQHCRVSYADLTKGVDLIDAYFVATQEPRT